MNTEDLVPLGDVLTRLDGPLTFARFLIGERERAGMTQSAAGKKLGISRQMVCDIEKGRQPVSVELAAKIAKTLKVSPTVAIEACLQDQLRRAHMKYTVTVAATKRA